MTFHEVSKIPIKHVLIACKLMFYGIVETKNSVCQSALSQFVLSDTSWLFYSFSAEGGFRRTETKSINHGADIK